MRLVLVGLGLVLGLTAQMIFVLNPSSQPAEESVGPFASWMCVQPSASGNCGVAAASFFTAVGNGVADDTSAIQACISAMSATKPVCYLPAGVYKITACIFVGTTCTTGTSSPTVSNIGIICQNPGNTSIIWYGSSGGTMFYLDDMINSVISRCTFDGHNSASILVAEDQPSGVIGSNYYSDNVFKNAGPAGTAGTGFQCGATAGCSEVVLLRDQFLNNGAIGAMTMNSNALNMWCWYCLFKNNATGIGDFASVGSVNGAGGLHVFKSNFFNQSVADIVVGNIVEENFLDNYSFGSNVFASFTGFANGGPFPIMFLRNTVLDTTSTGPSLVNNNTVITLLIDNVIRSLASASAPVINLVTNDSVKSDLLSVGNTLTLSSSGNCAGTSMPISVSISVTGSRCHEFNDQTVSRSSVNPTTPVLPSVPVNNGRTIFDASALTGAAIQTAINNAASGCTNNVAHIPAGTYVVSSTITVPANCRVQIIGDGWASKLTASGTPNPMLLLNGPSLATLRDFGVTGTSTTDAIEVDSADQSNSIIYGDNIQVSSNSAEGFFVDALDFARVELHNFLMAGNPELGLKVTGGVQAQAGSWRGGQTNVFAVNTENQGPGFAPSLAGHLLVVDDWLEAGGLPYSATGVGTVFTHAGASMATVASNPPTLTAFQGTAALLGENVAGGQTITISGSSGGASDLVLGDALASAPSNTATGSPTVGFLNSNTYGVVNPTVPLTETGPSSQVFLTAALNQLRSTSPIQLGVGSGGTTNLGIWHVNAGSAKCAIHIEAGTGVTC